MFNNLVESDAHRADHRRKASFFIYTLIGYAVLLLAASVASVYAYDAHLENQNLEFLVLVAPPMQEPQTIRRNEPPKANAGGGDRSNISVRETLIARINESTTPPDKISAAAPAIREMPPGLVVIGNGNRDANPFGNSNGPLTPGHNSPGNRDNGTIVKIDDDDKPPPLKQETPRLPKKIVTGGVLNGKAISLPKPPYPPVAIAVKASGTVIVEILLDETGKVISAHAVSGHPLLQAAAVKAAYQARFSPTTLSGQPVKVSGIINYNFTPR